MEDKLQYKIVYGLMGIIFLVMTYINILNQGSIGGADSYMHFMFAKWSFTHPYLLFNHWGKPMFTILSAPFAYFGFKVSVTFNILLTLFSGLIVAKSAQYLGVKNYWLGLLFTVFTPVFFLVSFSSLTETIFGFLTILSSYFFIQKKYHYSALVMSFIPFARTEGIIFIPILTFVLIWSKQYKSIPYLVVGFVIFASAGYPLYHDLLWPITQSPYQYESLYGTGDWYHFIEESPMLFGWPLIVLFLFGLLKSGIASATKLNDHKTIIYVLLAGISIGYFAAHSTVWAFGMGGSAGLTRVMAGITPVVALMAILGFDFLFKSLNRFKIMSIVFSIIMGVVIIIEGTTKHRLPIYNSEEENLLIEAIQYIKKENLDSNYIVYFNPIIAFEMGLDHFTIINSNNQVYDNLHPELNLPEGTIVIWDAHFASIEQGLHKKIMDTNPFYKKLKIFQPITPFTTYQNQQFEVIVYQKIQPLESK